jgi:NADPH-dependent F420 reductase
MQVGIVGGTGPAGRGLAVRASRAGHEVRLGSRDATRAEGVAATLRTTPGVHVVGCANEDAASSEVVVVATPWDAVVATLAPLAARLEGTVVVSMANALVRQGRELVALVPPRGSMAAELQAALPGARVTAAFHHLPAAEMEDLGSGLLADVLVCGDDAVARRVTCELADSLEGLRAVEAGSLAFAGPIEAFTAVCVSVNVRYKAHTTVRLEGL